MPVAIDEYQAGPIESHGVRMLRVCRSRTCTPEGAAPCDDCRIGPASLCAAQSEVGGAVVPPFRISEQLFQAGHDIVEAGEAGHEFWLIVDGWAVQYELLDDGSRQILDFLLPGSIAGLQPDGEALSPHFVQALTGVRACRFSRRGFFDTAKSNPALALRLAAIASQSHYRSLRRLTLIGRRTARERVAVLLFELYRRARRWSLSPREDEIPLPLTQEHIGDALGLTNVHVNRMLRELREEGMLILKRGVLRLLDPGRLAEIAGLDDHRVGPRPTSKMSILPHRTVQREPARQRARSIFNTG